MGRKTMGRQWENGTSGTNFAVFRLVVQVSGQTTPSKDSDARWTKKNGLYKLGYKQHTRTDEEGYIEKLHITPANTHECNHLSPLLEGLSEGMVAWRENERGAGNDYLNALKATNPGTGTNYECESGFTCHFQYIGPLQRCVPSYVGRYQSGPGPGSEIGRAHV